MCLITLRTYIYRSNLLHEWIKCVPTGYVLETVFNDTLLLNNMRHLFFMLAAEKKQVRI